MTNPQINIVYTTTGLVPPISCDLEDRAEDIIFNWGGVKIVRLSPTTVVKFGPHVSLVEASTLIFIAKNAPSVPAPRVYAYYTYGPLDRDRDDFGSIFDTYIIMDYIEGDTLDTVWESLDQNEKLGIMQELENIINSIRSISPGHQPYIGSVEHRPVADWILRRWPSKGPFSCEEAFNASLVQAYVKQVGLPNMKTFLDDLISTNKHNIVFTHGDFKPSNIIVKNGKVSGIVDWETSGWYPAYWEFAKAFYNWRWQNDWGTYLLEILLPYHLESMTHRLLADALW